MSVDFSPSVNLTRDLERTHAWFRTPNADRVYQGILNDYALGMRAFNIVGSYGTGKSAFLIALEKTLGKGEALLPSPNGHFPGIEHFEFINIVGAYGSFSETVVHAFQVANVELLWPALDRIQDKFRASRTCLVLVVDEFGKFLEHAAHTNPERELGFIQQLAEYANDTQKHFVLLTVLHQGFYSYALGLTSKQREDWEKVKGRFRELTFNEPVEQLLVLAATHMPQVQSVPTLPHPPALLAALDEARVIPYADKITPDFANRLAPLDLLAATVLTHALQHYGQNERSLFTFLSTNEHLGLQSYSAERSPYYNVANVHDYLLHNYYSLLITKDNPHLAGWNALRRARERVENTIASRMLDALQIVKIIGLLNIFAPKGARLTREFLCSYATLALGMTNPEPLLIELETRKIVRYVHFKESYVLFDGTDLDIAYELHQAQSAIPEVGNIALLLQKYFTFPFVMARQISYLEGTPRFFAFHLTESPHFDSPHGSLDGYINLIFEDGLDIDSLRAHSKQHEQTLFGWYRQTARIQTLLLQLQATEQVITTHRDDRVAVRELEDLRRNQIATLNESVLAGLYKGGHEIVWVWNGKIVSIDTRAHFDGQLSSICEKVYPGTPRYRNELINRHSLTSSVATARRNFLKALVDHWQEEDLGFPKEKFPAEKSVYLGLVRESGIHRQEEGRWTLDAPIDRSFQALWQACEQFLELTRVSARPLSELVDQLTKKPFKVKGGFVDFWLPLFLFARREAFALYYENAFIPTLAPETFDLVRKSPESFRMKAFTIDGVRQRFLNRCRDYLQQSREASVTTSTLIETLRPFLVFYAGLPKYAQQTARLSLPTLRLRTAISQAVDPEKAFFEDFPEALGYPELQSAEANGAEIERYVGSLTASMHELRVCYDGLVERLEKQLLEAFGLSEEATFPAYRSHILARYNGLRPQLLQPQLRALHGRLTAPLDERNAWLNGIVQALLSKQMATLRDEDEVAFQPRLQEALLQLDTLAALSRVARNVTGDGANNGAAMVIEFTVPGAANRRIARALPNHRGEEVETLKRELRARLDANAELNVLALLDLLREMADDN